MALHSDHQPVKDQVPLRPQNNFEQYHAHIYFDECTEAQARQLCLQAWQTCHVGLGRFHKRPIGPHPKWNCQLSFDAEEFDRLVTWLDANRGELDVLVHPLTGDALAEHTEHARWLGNEVSLNTDIFRR